VVAMGRCNTSSESTRRSLKAQSLLRARALLGARQKAVWNLKKRVEKLHYMHKNPLKRKLVDHPKDWPWSSFSFYSNSQHGLIRVDPVR
jgi:hypothetical protein